MHRKVMESRETIHYETCSTILHRWLAVSIFPSQSGGISVYFHDIEDRKKAEEALRHSEARARTLADAIPHIIWTNKPDGIASYFNKRWFEYSGLSEEDSYGAGWEAIVHPDDAITSSQRWLRAFSKGEVFDTEYRLRRHDGIYRWFIGRNVPLRNESGEVTGWFGSATDIHDLKEAEEAVRTSAERLRVTMDSAIDYSILTLDTAGIINGWSAGAQRTFGYTAEQAIGQHTSLIFTPEDKEAGAPEKEMLTAVQNGVAPDERWHLRASGERFYMSGVMRPILNPHVTGFVKVARDMTEQKLLEQQKDDFIGIASHELKTPLTSIKAYAEVLEEMFIEKGDEKSAGLMRRMDKQIDRLTELIRAMLDVTRISQGRLEISKDTFDLNALAAEVVEEMQVGTKHRLLLEAEPIPEVHADRNRIRQVLSNLLSNAIKYSPGEERVVLTIQQHSGNSVRVCVQDFGIGMPEDVSKKAFDRFFRAGGALASTYPGLGLGLYISAEIIRQHEGQIWVESKEGQGSTFCFSLPIKS